jgi:tRNA-dihydrouridine synthase A
MSHNKTINRQLCVAPMMDWTDRHCRHFHRLLAPNALLYTEMVTTGAIIHGDRDRHLGFDATEHPLALQLGGSDPADLARCATIAVDYGYDEINLNVGCPSDRVQSGRFGACLMREPSLVRDCLAAMIEAVDIPVTIKHRIGVDDQDEEGQLSQFVAQVAESGCRTFIVHARKALLKGLSPKMNREVPPLNYPRVARLKSEFPDLQIIINGGIDNLDAIDRHLAEVDGVMIGLAAYQHPYWLAEVEKHLFGTPLQSRESYVQALLPYVAAHLSQGGRLQHISRHLLGLYQCVPGAKYWRRTISQQAYREGADGEVLIAAMAAVAGNQGTPVEMA